MPSKLLREAPSELAAIQAQTDALILPHFTNNDAFSIGIGLRLRLLDLYPNASCVINITSSNSDNLLFHCTTGPGVQPDNDLWVARKRNTVKRWGVSSWYMHHKMSGDQEAFKNKYALGDQAGQYAIHGGGVPLRVRGIDATVGVVVVSGLQQNEDHQVIVETLEDFIAS